MKEKKAVCELLEGERLKRLYANTFYSLTDRIGPFGYIEESFVPGRYPGCFIRSAGAYVFLMEENGYPALAQRALRFVLDTLKREGLSRCPHVIGDIHVEENGAVRQNLDMVNQLDGTAHIIAAYAYLLQRHADESLYTDYWEMMAQMLTLHADQPFFFSSAISRFPVVNVDLFLNTSFEHSREERYWCCFDLLTQSFMGAALHRMIAVCRQRKLPEKRLAFWQQQLTRLQSGIERHLTLKENGEVRYMEMRLPDSNDGVAFDPMGWVCLSPVAAQWEALSPSVMDSTVKTLRGRLWRESPSADGTFYLEKDEVSGGADCAETIGKGIGWDMEYARRQRDFGHIAEVLRFLRQNHAGDLYGECMLYKDGAWHVRDCGNAEQAIWWCWAVARLRADMGLSAVPLREDVTHPITEYRLGTW